MIRLERFTPADFNQLIEWISSEQLMKEWSGSLFSFPLTADSLAWYIEGANDLKNPDVFVYKAVDSKTGETVGHISLGSLSQRDKSGRITRVLVSDGARGKGVCRRMAQALLRIGFEELGLHRITLGVYDFNHSAIKCYLKAGFQQEGVMRDVVRHGDTYWTLIEMAILEDEWRAQQQPATAASPAEPAADSPE